MDNVLVCVDMVADSIYSSYVALVPQVVRPGVDAFVHINVLRGWGREHLTTNLLDGKFKVISSSKGRIKLPGNFIIYYIDT